MSRYLELTVSGTLDAVAERSRRAFRSIGRVRHFDPESCVEGILRTEGHPVRVTVRWGPARTAGQIHLDIRASTRTLQFRDADDALYDFVRAYRDTDWPDPEADRIRHRRRITGLAVAGGLGLIALVAAVILVF